MQSIHDKADGIHAAILAALPQKDRGSEGEEERIGFNPAVV